MLRPAADREAAARALVALSAGSQRWRSLDVATYQRQLEETSGFWMSFHELIAGYPWLTKRTARVLNPNATLPNRNPLAYIPALIVPFSGRLGMVPTVVTPRGQLVFEPSKDERGRITWSCSAGEGTRVQYMPQACRQSRP